MRAHAPRLLPTPDSTGSSAEALIRQRASNELVFAVVGHAGSGTTEVAKRLENALQNESLRGGPFEVSILKARSVISDWADKQGLRPPKEKSKSLEQTIQFQDLGDKMREADHSAVARALIARIRTTRAASQHSEVGTDEVVIPDGARRAYVLDSIRHPAEVHLLRRVYQSGFTLIGVVCEEEIRLRRLMKKYDNAGEDRARRFMGRDAQGGAKHGQRVSDAFHLADVFLDNTAAQIIKDSASNPLWTIPDQLVRLVQLITHEEVFRPTDSESAMYAAFCAQLRSSCLSRQVGAALLIGQGTVVATGTNEAPRAGGGAYLELDPGMNAVPDGRCFRGKKVCSNTQEQNEIIQSVVDLLPSSISDEDRTRFGVALSKSRIGSLIEFSRAVHAEMDALLSAARRGVSAVGARLFVTTFPCHYCARHLVSAGVDEVQFIEPYPKSQALKLHRDSITMDPQDWKRPSEGGDHVLFRPFAGIAPRMYERAFFKDRELKDSNTGAFQIGEPDWGSAWDMLKVSYPQLEVELSKQV